MEEKDKKKQAGETYLLQKALVHYAKAASNQNWEDKSPCERKISQLANALLMELHKQIEDEKLEVSNPRQPKMENLADQFMALTNELLSGRGCMSEDVADDFLKTLKLFDIAREAKEKGKTLAIEDKYKKI